MLIRFKWLLNVPRLLSLTLHNVKVFSTSIFTITIIIIITTTPLVHSWPALVL